MRLYHLALLIVIILSLSSCSSLLTKASPPKEITRIGLFNIRELSTEKLDTLDEEGRGADEQLLAAASIIQKVRPNVLVLNEIDHDYDGATGRFAALGCQEGEPDPDWTLERNPRKFLTRYLLQGNDPIDYPYIYVAPSNTGILSGLNLNMDDVLGTCADIGGRDYGNDSFGYGNYPGQYAMAILSQHPIDKTKSRTFQKFLWKDMENNLFPDDFYSEEIKEVFRLSSKSHWDTVVNIDGMDIHLLASHPTPQGFDGGEDRNGKRNFDEIKFWVHYIEGRESIYDDEGVVGGLSDSDPFIIVGDLNSSPYSGSRYEDHYAVELLLDHPKINDVTDFQTSRGAVYQRSAGPPNFFEKGTFGYGEPRQIDYVLPSHGLDVVGGGVYWPDPESGSDGYDEASRASDHRLIWLDILTP